MIPAIAIYLLAAMVALWLEDRLRHAVRGVPVTAWLTEHVYVPMLRAFTLLLFIAAAYPAIFGPMDAPPLGQLLDAHPDGLDVAMNSLLLVSLLLPLIPGAPRVPGLILVTQGIVATALLAGWVAETRPDIELRVWAGWPVTLKVVAALLGGYAVGEGLRRAMGRDFDDAHPGVAADAARLTAQLPAIVIYARALGAQLA